MTYQNVGMDYTLNVGSLLDASYDVIEARIRQVLNGAPVPYIDTNCPYCNMIRFEHPEYDNEYRMLLEFYVKNFGTIRQLDVDVYGFTHWESAHPLINKLMMTYEAFHWLHMEKHVDQVAREVKIRELESGIPYTEANRIELIKEKATALRKNEIAADAPYYQSKMNQALNAPMMEFYRDKMNSLPAEEPRGGTIIDQALDFQQEHPLIAGWLGAEIFHRVKDAFKK